VSDKQSGTILRRIHLMAASEGSDEQLLRAFIECRDESAFAILVQRHGSLVHRVCQSVLQHRQDAEDAFQATFLVLARKAALIRRGQSLTSWLHGVAYRLTMEMTRNAARRRIHEKQAKTMPQRNPSEELKWREVEAILHEEIDRLPPKYRAAFLLCVLEDVSRSDAARELGILEGTLSSRLAHARKLLQDRLARRGVSLASVLGIVAISRQANAAIRLPLVKSTLKVALSPKTIAIGAACAVPAGILTIIEGVERTMSISKLKVSIASLFAVGFVAVGLGGLPDLSLALATEPNQSKPASAGSRELGNKGEGINQPPSKAASKDENTSIPVQGIVLGPDGKPVAGAKLYLGHYSPNDEVTVTESSKSDAAGHFKFSFTKNLLNKAHPDHQVADHPQRNIANFEPRPRDEADPYFTPVGQVIAVLEGFGCDWARIDPAAGSTELTLRLVKDVPINGRVLDKEGKPVADAKVRLSSLNAYTGEGYKNALAEFPKSNHFPLGSKRWGGWLPGQAKEVRTGKDGSFSMIGLGGERLVYLHIEGRAIESADIKVVTQASDQFDGPDKFVLPEGAAGAGTEIQIEPEKIYGTKFRYLAAASRPIRGVITDKETGKPLAGVLVGVGRNRGNTCLHGTGVLTTRTDREGRYEVLGCPKSPSYDIVAQPADPSQHFTILSSEIPDAPGLGPMTIDLKLPPGIPIRGKVLDERTGKPIPGARVNYYPFQNFAGATKMYAGFDHAWAESSAIAGPDGSYAVAVLPGPGILGTVAPDFTWAGGTPTLSKAYSRAELSDKEFDAFVEKYQLPDQGLPRRVKGNEQDLIVTLEHSQSGRVFTGLVPAHYFNHVVLLHPDEKDKELKRDLVLRPTVGEKPKDNPKKDK
jgi:RNA polymerase sigma factor (sigma-70 family)